MYILAQIILFENKETKSHNSNFFCSLFRLTIYISILDLKKDGTMSNKDLIDEKVDSEDEEDDDYCPVKNDKEQSDSSEESEHEDEAVNEQTESKKQTELNITPYDPSKTDELWKNFTSSTKSSSSTTTTTTSTPPKITESQNPKPITKVFDYAGEKVSVPVPTNPSLKRPVASSSNSVLDRLGIGKKQKLSTLEKSRLDWNSHKQSEALVDDLDSHRRSKDSYVERKAFLERSEHREYDHFLTNVKKK